LKKYKRVNDGEWTLVSKKDPRFNCSGYGKVGWLHIPYSARDEILKNEKLYNVDAPDDLELIYDKGEA
jgi:hypothetical protein